MSVQRDVDKPNIVSFLTPNDRLSSCRRLAAAMISKSKLSIRNDQIGAILKLSEFETKRPTNVSEGEFLQKVSTDIRLCSFLMMDGNDELKFSHASFMEFFFAQELVMNCQESLEYLRLHVREASQPAVVYFLGSFARSSENFARQLRFALATFGEQGPTANAPLDDAFNALILRIVWTSGALLQNKHLRHCTISRSKFGKSVLSGAYFEDVDLQHLSIYTSTLEDCVFEKCKATNVVISNSLASKCKINYVAHELEVLNSTFEGGKFSVASMHDTSKVDLRTLEARDWTIRDSVFRNGSVSLSGKGVVANGRISDKCNLIIEADAFLDTGTDLFCDDSVVMGRKIKRAGVSSQGPQASWLSEDGATAIFISVFFTDFG